MDKYDKSYEILSQSYDQFYTPAQDAKSFEFLTGEISDVVFSCPHAVSQLREGKEKWADINTGPLGLALHYLGYSVMIKTKNCNDDANYDMKSPYKDYLSEYVKKNNIKYLIDLHGMSKKRNILISLGTSFGAHSDKSLELTNQFIKIANKNGLNTEQIGIDFPFSGALRTVSAHINRKNKIETLQVEINSRIYEDKDLTIKLIKTLDEYARLARNIKTFVAPKLITKKVYENDLLFSNDSSEEIFKSINLNSPILITAPHSCAMIKEGKECYRETFSGAIVKTLSDSFKLSCCYKVKPTTYDSNEEYINTVNQFVKDNKIKLVLEFHIMNPKRYEDISIVTNQGYSIDHNIELISILLKSFILNKFDKVSLDYPFNAFNLNSSVASIYKNTGVPALQIIFNQRLFKNKRSVKQLLNAVTEIIKKLNYFV